MFNTILFDLDGTLTKPEAGIVRCIEYALYKMNAPIPEDTDFSAFIGPPLQGTFKKILKTDDHQIIDQALSFYRERFREKGQYENEVYEGIEPLLKELLDRGKQLFVATSKPEVFAKNILSHFKLSTCFSGIYGAGLDGTRSDKSALLDYILKKEKVDPSDVVMIGDRKYDIEGALANNIASVGVLWGYGSKEELQSAGATFLCNDIPCLFDTLLGIKP